jgi:hypothetical protein
MLMTLIRASRHHGSSELDQMQSSFWWFLQNFKSSETGDVLSEHSVFRILWHLVLQNWCWFL